MDSLFVPQTSIFDLVLCLAQAVDLVSPLVADHHKRTAQIAYGLGLQMKFPEDELRDLVMAAALHDVGGLTRQDRLDALDFEFQDPFGHAVRGYLLLQTFPPFENTAAIVRFHHVPWSGGKGAVFGGLPVPRSSHLLHLADRVAVLIDPSSDILEQVDGILAKILPQSGERFDPFQVNALQALAEKEAFWLDTIYGLSLETFHRRVRPRALEIGDDEFFGLCQLFRRIIDFRSQFTATHSAGVGACAEGLARLSGFNESNCRLIHLAGLLHDLGKLAVPAEILEKPGPLTPEEYDLVRRHTYYTFRILEPLKILDIVRVWGAYHHERMDGHGYPFHLQEGELPLGSRIVSVADVFTSLTEDRPYRKGLEAGQALNVLADASSHRQVDTRVVATLRDHLAVIENIRREAEAGALEEYKRFIDTAQELAQIE